MNGKEKREVPPLDARTGSKVENDSGPRRRVRSRMHELLLAGTAASIGLSATLCAVACDPMPPPVWSCSDSAGTLWNIGLYATATWHRADQAWSVAVQMSMTDWLHASSSLEFSGNPVVTGAKVTSVKVDTMSVAFTCVPDTGIRSVTAAQPLHCSGEELSVKFELDVSANKAEGAVVPLRTLR
jgi:hypothetical protein